MSISSERLSETLQSFIDTWTVAVRVRLAVIVGTGKYKSPRRSCRGRSVGRGIVTGPVRRVNISIPSAEMLTATLTQKILSPIRPLLQPPRRDATLRLRVSRRLAPREARSAGEARALARHARTFRATESCERWFRPWSIASMTVAANRSRSRRGGDHALGAPIARALDSNRVPIR